MPPGANDDIACASALLYILHSQAHVAKLDIGRGDMPPGANGGIACAPALLVFITHFVREANFLPADDRSQARRAQTDLQNISTGANVDILQKIVLLGLRFGVVAATIILELGTPEETVPYGYPPGEECG